MHIFFLIFKQIAERLYGEKSISSKLNIYFYWNLFATPLFKVIFQQIYSNFLIEHNVIKINSSQQWNCRFSTKSREKVYTPNFYGEEDDAWVCAIVQYWIVWNVINKLWLKGVMNISTNIEYILFKLTFCLLDFRKNQWKSSFCRVKRFQWASFLYAVSAEE